MSKERVSNRAIELRVEWLNKALGRATEHYVSTGKGHSAPTDAFYVDHSYGGYRLEAQGNPMFGHGRLSKSALCDQLEAILVAIKLARDEQSGAAWPKAKQAA